MSVASRAVERVSVTVVWTAVLLVYWLVARLADGLAAEKAAMRVEMWGTLHNPKSAEGLQKVLAIHLDHCRYCIP